jgi:CO/xanthine dehydrogenase Mo-binding subunit
MPYDVGLGNYRNSGPVVLDSGDYPAVLRRALEVADYPRLSAESAAARHAGRRLGVGVACYVELTGVGPYEGAAARVDAVGRITVSTGVTSQGQGLETTLAQVAAGELGVTPDDVSVIAGDTAGIAQGIGTFASRAAVVGGTAVALAARDLRQKALRLAAHVLGIPEDEVEQDGRTFAQRSRPKHRVELGRLASVASLATAAHGIEPGLEVTRYFQPPDMTYSSGAHVARVEVDADSGAVRLLDYVVCHDSGRLINPMIVEGQIMGAVALGIGGALLEEVRYDEQGQPLAGTFMDYAMPRSTDVPPLRIEHLETLSPLNPLGLKGVGESGTLPVSAVLASAIEDALAVEGLVIRRMPLTPPRLHALRQPCPPTSP